MNIHNRLLISDLDGTLLDSQKNLSDFTVKTINKFIAIGGNFTIATARALESAKPLINRLNLKLPFILHNGVKIYDPIQNGYILENCISKNYGFQIIDFLKNQNLSPILYATNEYGKSRVFYKKINNPSENAYFKDRLSRGDPRFRKVDEYPLNIKSIIEINSIDKYDILKEVNSKIKTNFNVQIHFIQDEFFPDYFWLELTHPKATKENALNYIKNLLNYEETIAFGDDLNDISLFRASTKGFAVRNAKDALKNISTDVIESNDNDGVAKFIFNNFMR